MKIIHKIVIRLRKKDWRWAAAINEVSTNKIWVFFKKLFRRDNCKITINLYGFKYRKNVSYKKVAKDMNNFFLIELICAMTRVNRKNRMVPCNENYKNCPIDNIWGALRLWKIKS